MLSSLLQWHEWLKKPCISRESARKSGMATSWLMRTMKSVAPRHTGMKNNTIKMHLVHHIGEDILDFGVPQNVNSAFAESAHIHLAKITSKNTQRRPETFTLQAAERYVENLTIERSHIEVKPQAPLLSNTQTQECRRQSVIWMDLQNRCHFRFFSWHHQQLPQEAKHIDRLEHVWMDEWVKNSLFSIAFRMLQHPDCTVSPNLTPFIMHPATGLLMWDNCIVQTQVSKANHGMTTPCSDGMVLNCPFPVESTLLSTSNN